MALQTAQARALSGHRETQAGRVRIVGTLRKYKSRHTPKTRHVIGKGRENLGFTYRKESRAQKTTLVSSGSSMDSPTPLHRSSSAIPCAISGSSLAVPATVA